MSTTTTPTEPSPAMIASGDEIVARLSSRQGQQLSPDVTFGPTSRSGNTVTGVLVVNKRLSDILRQYRRGELQGYLRSVLRDGQCEDALSREFIDAGGRFRINMTDPSNTIIATTTISNC
ncbi:hypothetical protein Q4555_11145 [Octadecabacter sp. 1_MG-2023]|uniref:hypothetical protein n=1 Tax=unclassified Octadecabacter TaxID=196158 RepID=UPI001C0A0C0D|nr:MULTISPECIES: hypothetical protein [unclassified Octadecabacter]MBU2993929.1 hypothetical protein [Octadecabacter sp. B2R22]MDO6735225.1 hypothetical protein [Octadecabacter sp. 1_MG-2023]